MSAFTPGPWRWDTAGKWGTWLVTKETSAPILTGNIGFNNQADGNLIAAAPEMYEALKEAAWIIDAAYATAEWLKARRSIETDEIRERVKSALAKAEGRS